jgi:hypothetical protein
MRSHLLCWLRWMTAIVVCVAAWPASATSEPQRIYRCGNSYTNQPDPAAHCKPLASGSVTVIEGTRVQGASASAGKVDSTEQRQRDTQAQTVLQAELQRALKQHSELLREWNNGEPERRADEHRQPQKYQDRVAQLRGALQRTEADVAGLQRELARFNASTVTSPGVKP